MWLAQTSPLDPTQWGPLGLAASLVAWFFLALAKGWIRWGRECDRELDVWKTRTAKAETERDEALGAERRLRDSTQQKLERALEVLSATTAAVRRK